MGGGLGVIILVKKSTTHKISDSASTLERETAVFILFYLKSWSSGHFTRRGFQKVGTFDNTC